MGAKSPRSVSTHKTQENGRLLRGGELMSCHCHIDVIFNTARLAAVYVQDTVPKGKAIVSIGFPGLDETIAEQGFKVYNGVVSTLLYSMNGPGLPVTPPNAFQEIPHDDPESRSTGDAFHQGLTAEIGAVVVGDVRSEDGLCKPVSTTPL